MSAQADYDDARQAAAQRRAFAEFQGQLYGSAPNGVELEAAVAARAAARAHAADQRSQAKRKVTETHTRREEMLGVAEDAIRMNDEEQAEARQDRQYRQRFGLRFRSTRGFGFRRAD